MEAASPPPALLSGSQYRDKPPAVLGEVDRHCPPEPGTAKPDILLVKSSGQRLGDASHGQCLPRHGAACWKMAKHTGGRRRQLRTDGHADSRTSPGRKPDAATADKFPESG